MTILRTVLASLALVFVLGSAGGRAEEGRATQPLTIVSAEGSHDFQVEFAADDKARARGLMFRKRMAPDHGMLFDFGRAQPVAMWMKNTFIPLDMLFIASDGRVVQIHRNARPHDLTPIRAMIPVRAVLELKGGITAELGIRAGDRVRHPLFKAPD